MILSGVLSGVQIMPIEHGSPPVRTAYLITAYNDPLFLDMLVASLEPQRRDVFIHLDAKSDETRFHLPHIKQAYMMAERRSVHWATRSFADAIMHLLQTAMDAGPFDYFVLLSGSDFPVRPLAEFETFLGEADCRSFHTFKPALATFEGRKRLRSHYVLKKRTNLNIALQKALFVQSLLGPYCSRRPPACFSTYYYGPPWFTVHRTMAQWMLDCWDNVELKKYFATVYCPEEILIPTMIASSPWPEYCVQRSTRYIEWQGSAHPKTLNIDDLPKIVKSGRFFARKLTSAASLDLVDRLNGAGHLCQGSCRLLCNVGSFGGRREVRPT